MKYLSLKKIVIIAFLLAIPLTCHANYNNEISPDNQSLYYSQTELQSIEDQASKGNGNAAHTLSLYYDYIVIDPHKGFYWEEMAAKNGNVDAQYDMGIRYIYDPEIRNIEKAMYWFKKTVENKGNNSAQKRFLNHYFSLPELGKLKKIANSGDPKACEKLMGFYEFIENDYSQAHYWFNIWLKNKYYHTNVNDKLPNEDLKLSREQIRDFSSKAERGNGLVANKLHSYYEIVNYYSKGFYWLVRAANNGNIEAQYELGNEYLHNKKIKNKDEALFWFKKAAEQGDLTAKEKVEKFLSADEREKLVAMANSGDADAAFKLYEYYYWIESDKKQAKFWLNFSAKNGNPRAKALIK